MKAVAVIPARYGSTRFEGKPLAMLSGKPMVQWVYENAASCALIDQVIVATDDHRIARAVQEFGGTVRLTASTHETGTDRVAEAARDIDAEIIVNIQGDEPLLPREAIRQAVEPLLDAMTISMGTLKTKIRDFEDITNINVVKVVTDARGFALYFSRSAIPYAKAEDTPSDIFRHIGLYAYRKDFLMKFTELPQSSLEKAESLEQLRALEYGYAIKVVETQYYPVGVDVPEDVARVERLLACRLDT
ncbi:MAG: 3-deoxy-manno-octulosonate cytidylyltransferase [Pseudomonadota bacterium]